MKTNELMRQVHRWVSVVFVMAVIANLAVLFSGSQVVWVGFLALPPLLFLLVTGVYLFVLPYLKGRGT